VFVCATLATVPNYLVFQQQQALPAGETVSWLTTWGTTLPSVAAAIVYLLTCRHARFAVLIRVALLANATALAAYALASRGTAAGSVQLALMAVDAGDSFADIALLDLALRVTPPGREAFGTALLLTLSSVAMTVVNTSAAMIRATAGGAAWFAAGAALAAVLAVSLLPRAVVELREGRVGSPP
jgi:hypothetical protein